MMERLLGWHFGCLVSELHTAQMIMVTLTLGQVSQRRGNRNMFVSGAYPSGFQGENGEGESLYVSSDLISGL